MIETLIFIIGYIGLLLTSGWFNLLTVLLFIVDASQFILIIFFLRNMIKLPFYMETFVMFISISTISALFFYYNNLDEQPLSERKIEFIVLHSGSLAVYSILCMVLVHFYNKHKIKNK